MADFSNLGTKIDGYVRGIIFDLDGTLIKSVVDFPKMKRRMIEFINDLPMPGTNYKITQTTNEIISDLNVRMLQNGMSERDREEILNKISRILTEVEFENLDLVELNPGVKEFIQHCYKNGIKMGILTRASRDYLLASLEKTGIIEYFSVILSRDEFTLLKAKPHQFALEYTIKELGLPPENILFVGDHEIDFNCARNGNIRFVGVLSGSYNRIRFKEIGCEEVVSDFDELAKLLFRLNT